MRHRRLKGLSKQSLLLVFSGQYTDHQIAVTGQHHTMTTDVWLNAAYWLWNGRSDQMEGVH